MMTADGPSGAAHGNRPPLARAALALVLVKLIAHLAANVWTPYEFHRDAFLYTAMGTHLRFFHMDFPPFMALLAQGVRSAFGDSLLALRLFPALAGAGVLLLTVLLTREFGGGRRAQLLAGLAVLLNPLFLRSANLFQPVVFDQLWWLLACYALARHATEPGPRWWLLVGLAGGLGLLTKFSIVFLGAGVLAGILLTANRRELLGPWPWAALGIALVIGAPSLLGQANLDFPVLDQMAVLRERQLARVGVGEFVLEQVLMQPAGFVLGAGGGLALLLHPALRPFRALGWVALATGGILVAMQGKAYYYGPVHPLLFAAGAAALGRLDRPRPRTAAFVGLTAAVGVYGALAVPFGLPVVPPAPMARLAAAVGITAAVRTNWGEVLPLPQDFADMLGWRDKAEAAGRVYRNLSAEEREDAVLFGRNYGQAGSLDFYGRALDLPPVVSLAGSFYLFGPGTRPGRVVIFVGMEPEEIDQLGCESLQLAERVRNSWGVPEERDVPIVVCWHPATTLQEFWRRVGRPRWG